jgi:hypothetical protein
MIVYNVTVKVDLAIHELSGALDERRPYPKGAGDGLLYPLHKFYRIMEENQSDGMTYAVQYLAGADVYFDYQNNHAPRLQKETRDPGESNAPPSGRC